MKIADLMTPCPHKIESRATVEKTLDSMKLNRIRHLPVVDDDGELVGVITDRDAKLSKFVCLSLGHCPSVGDLCAKDPTIVQADSSASSVAEEMAEKRLDYVLVADSQGNLVGIFTATDACRFISVLIQEARK